MLFRPYINYKNKDIHHLRVISLFYIVRKMLEIISYLPLDKHSYQQICNLEVDFLEAYYLNDPRIEEWVEQIIETVLTSCLLTGTDSDQEYQKGCEIVEKLTTQLLGLSMFPSQYLADGLRQILDQQLPDSRVINNFPTFQETMNKMLNEGMVKVLNNKKVDIISSLDQDITMPAFASMDHKDIIKKDNICEIIEVNKVQLVDVVSEVNELERESISSDIDSSIDSVVVMNSFDKVSPVPHKAERLKDVLNYIFPDAPILWNTTLQGERFLAQVEDLLICRFDPAYPCQTEKFEKDGWRVMLCHEEDLTYPRRLERKIKHIMRRRKNLNLS